MKCPNCGAEIKNNSKFCEFCGSAISTEMRREQEQLNKAGCPKCGSTNISFSREKQGEIRGKGGTAVVRSTVGMCKDCGYTWQTDSGIKKPKKRKTWLWVLGWIFIFPVPLTILMLRKKNMKPAVKYGIIIVAWLIYIMIAISGNSENTTTPASDNQPVQNTAISATIEAQKETHIYDNAEIKDVLNGARTNKIGEYSVIRASSDDCTEATLADWYYNFVQKNNYNYNIILFTDKEDLTGCYSINGMVEVGTAFIEDEHGDYMIGETHNSVIYSPSGDGNTLKRMEFNSFYVTEGEAGDYGYELTLNKGTEFEETKFYYLIPEGDYTITNMGSFRAQVSVYKNEVVKNEAGWEEFAEAFGCVVLDADERSTLHIGENQCVEITEGGEIRFELN